MVSKRPDPSIERRSTARGSSRSGARRVTFDATDDRSPAAAITRAVVTEVGVDPSELEPLGSSIDPEALEGLFDSLETTPGAVATVSFPYAGYWVSIDSEGTLTVTRCDR